MMVCRLWKKNEIVINLYVNGNAYYICNKKLNLHILLFLLRFVVTISISSQSNQQYRTEFKWYK